MKTFGSSFVHPKIVAPKQLTSNDELGERLSWDMSDYNDNLDNVDFTANNELQEEFHTMYGKDSAHVFHENARKIPAIALASTNKYRKGYKSVAVEIGQPMQDRKGAKAQEYATEAIASSLFNSLYGVRIQGITLNTPLMTSAAIDYTGETTMKPELFTRERLSDGDAERIAASRNAFMQNNLETAYLMEKQRIEEEIHNIDLSIEEHKRTLKALNEEYGNIGKEKKEEKKDDDSSDDGNSGEKPKSSSGRAGSTSSANKKDDKKNDKKDNDKKDNDENTKKPSEKPKPTQPPTQAQKELKAQEIADAKAANRKQYNEIGAQITNLQNVEKPKLINQLNNLTVETLSDENKFSQEDILKEYNEGASNKNPVIWVDGIESKPGNKNVSDSKFIQNETEVQINNHDREFTDCSIRTIVNLSNGVDNYGNRLKDSRQLMGRATYRYADFMYCKDLGKVSNNHLITLRKFSSPVGDNIFKRPNNRADKEIASTAKLVTWFGTEDNKLEDICKYNYNATWKHMKAEIQDIYSKEDSSGKLLPSLVNMFNPAYNAGVAKGYWGGGNCIYGWIASKCTIFGHHIFENKGSYEGDSDLYHIDKNKIYEPPNTIRQTHQYDGELTFAQDFTLKFSYKLRSYDGINPKSAFLDLIGNILEITYAHGGFWGGARRFHGAPRNQAGWNKVNKMFNKLDKGIHNGIESLFGCSSLEDLASLCAQALKAIGAMISGAIDKIKGMYQSGELKSKAKKFAHAGADVLQGMLKNKLGRPAIYAADSLLSGADVGLWHVTIGNPRNPIMAMGNLILQNAEIQHSGPLGIDDFPTELTVTIQLKHARPRDITKITSMYTCGQGGIYVPLKSRNHKKYFSASNLDEGLQLGGYGVTKDAFNPSEDIFHQIEHLRI